MFERLNTITADKQFPINGRNSRHENIIIERGDRCFKITTSQTNGWCRVNYYYEDGTCEELYER